MLKLQRINGHDKRIYLDIFISPDFLFGKVETASIRNICLNCRTVRSLESNYFGEDK